MESTEHPIYKLLQQKLNDIDQELAKADIPDEVYERLYIWKDLFTYVDTILHTKRFPHVPKRILQNLQNNISNFNISVVHNPRLANTSLIYEGIMGEIQKIPVFADKGTLGKGLSSLVESFSNQAESSVLNFSNERKKAIEDWDKEKETLQQSVETLHDEKLNLAKDLESLRTAISTQQGLNQHRGIRRKTRQNYRNG